MSRIGLRTRLAAALVATAVLAVAIATVLSNHGLPSRLEEAAEGRLTREATHLAGVAAAFYDEEGGWTQARLAAVHHLAQSSELDAEVVTDPAPPATGPRRAAAPVVVDGTRVGWIVVAPAGDRLLTPEEEHLRHSLDRLHLAAAGLSALAALVLAFVLGQQLSAPLRRIRAAAERIAAGGSHARVTPGGGPELAAVANALNGLADTLAREEELRKQSVADLAHELRTPVGALLSRIEAAQDGVLEPTANLEAMHAEALRLGALLDDLSRLADAERPGFLVTKEPVDLAALAEEQTLLWRPRLDERGLELVLELRPAVVAADRARLAQVLANLLSNACRYTEAGGRVTVRTHAAGADAVLEVADTGIGIAPDDLPHVFKRFWRAEKSRSRATGGTGIGLAIAQELVAAHAGRIDVESLPGAGTTFRVRLPALAAAEASHSLHIGTRHS
jgi:two-component system, OmpR family, sensor histidine kinase BaeS